MRRVILAVTATVAGLVALLSFKSHSPERSVLPQSAPLTGAGGESTSGETGAGPVKLAPGERAVTGNVANTDYGPVQIQLIVKAGKIVKVSVLEQPTSTQEDVQIGQFAFPKLIAETLTSQSARIDTVSGASYTSGGYIQSLQSALDNGV
ncbi:MAG: FMN-binding protein [Trebonia sp.]